MADPDATIALPDEVAVVNIGLSLLADAVRDQSTAVQQVDWRIPADGRLDRGAAACRVAYPGRDLSAGRHRP
jgi:hypothetical protein